MNDLLKNKTASKKDAPIDNWLQNTLQNLWNDSAKLPTDWMQVLDLHANKEWPLLYSFSTERLDKERLAIPVMAFQFWEQKDFKTLLFVLLQWIKKCFISLNLKRKSIKELHTCYWKLKSSGVKKMFKEIPIIESEDALSRTFAT